LEPAAQAATFTVNSTADTDDGLCNVANCTLREAINAANGAAGADKITFNIAGGGVKTINLQSGLPTITGVLAIDGTTQPGFAGVPLIELNGLNAGGSASGLRITAGSSTIKGLVINHFPGYGILIDTSGSNVIQGNYIGTDATGTAEFGNTLDGVHIDGSANNTIGGTTTAARNVISGNNGDGIFITSNGATGNHVQGNYVGTNAAGTAGIRNRFGVRINAASNNTIGGTSAAARNVISGNLAGVFIDVSASGNVVQGNYIGTDVTGALDLGHQEEGVEILSSPNNTIGGTTTAARNVISGNNDNGIEINIDSTGNLVQGNYIGTNAAGTSAVPNGRGVRIVGAPNNTIGGTAPGARNIISGNSGSGISFTNTATGNLVQGNYIGTDVNGTANLGNSASGVTILSSPNNIIGGTTGGARNVISGNNESGVLISSNDATGNQIQGNYIGTNAVGSSAVPNTHNGVMIDNAPNNTIGGTVLGARNIISGNFLSGISIIGNSATGNLVQGNYLGTTESGNAELGNRQFGVEVINSTGNNTIGGTAAGAGNVISGNGGSGVVFNNATSGNVVQGNFIGTNGTGTTALGNMVNGLNLSGTGHLIGGTTSGARNVISGNTFYGIKLAVGATGCLVQGNYIGTDVTGTVDLGNAQSGVAILSAPSNTIGGTVTAARNLISGNNTNGIEISDIGSAGNLVQGNYIGTTASGNAHLGNTSDGVRVSTAASNNTIGGTVAGAGNVISGNNRAGVFLSLSTSSNVVQGNLIGTDATGTIAIGNSTMGVDLNGTGQTVGGVTASARNVISGNTFDGVRLSVASGCLVQGNYIGTDITRNSALPNGRFGVSTSGNGTNNTIGGTTNAAANVIAFSGSDGVRIQSASDVGNSIRRNAIFSNDGLGIKLRDFGGVTPNDAGDGDTGPNNLQNFPVITSAVSLGGNTTIQGTLNSAANTQFALDLYANNACDASGNGEGQNFISSTTVTTNASGDASFTLTVPTNTIAGQSITATATDPNNNTSEFSACATLQSQTAVQFSATSYDVVEDCTTVTITVNRIGDTSEAATVDYSTADVTASERRDYITAIGKLRFAAGENAKDFAVLINEDSYGEGNETFNVSLSNPSGALLGAPALATVQITDDPNEPAANVIDDPPNFVCQQYHDFLNRTPDPSGLAFWTNEITSCGSDQTCIQLKRINVSAAFYLSIEFQGTGYLVERINKAAYGNSNGTSTFGGNHTLPVPIVRLSEFLPDTQRIGSGVIVGQAGWEQVLENNKQAFSAEFVQRSRFTLAYPGSMTPAQFVDTLNANAGNPLSQSERNQLVNDLTSGARTRAQVLRAVAEDSDLINAENNRAFVLMQYFGYLRRNPNDPQDTDYTGYDFWLTKLDQFNGNFVNAEMVKAFITSGEYRQRFGP